MLRQFTAKTYLLALSLFGLALFAVFGFNLLVRGDQIQQAMLQEKQQAAGEELKRAITTVVSATHHTLDDLAQWDEIHQQLGDPTYYVYWRELRLKKSQRFPAYIHGLELYGPDRTSLVSLPYQNFPSHVPDQVMSLQRLQGKEYLMAYAPIKERDSSEKVQGYLGIQIDFIAAMRELNRFVAIDPTTLDFPPKVAGTLPVSDVSNVIQFEPVSEAASSRLGDILITSLRDFFFLFASMLVVFYFTVALLFVRPLVSLQEYIGRLRRGEGAHAAEPVAAVTELVTLRESLTDYQRELDHARSQLDQQNVELWQLAHRDALTGAKNRLAFDEDWNKLLQLARDKRIDISLMLLDCDFFKAINDTYGHEVGDRVIQSISESLRGVLREGESLYRLGGDEFVTVLINAGRDEAHQVAHRCIDAVQNDAFKQLGIKETIKLSVGLAHASGLDIANLSELPRQADVAMYHAKSSTREKIVHYVPSLEQNASALVSNRIVGAVLQALETGEGIKMHYQPLVDADSHQPVYYEALVRISDAGGPISPVDIFPIIARRRLDVELDKAVLRAIEQDLKSGHIPDGVGISVNVSGALLALNDFCEFFSGLATHLANHPIVIEITETSFISHLQHASECLRKLRQHGFLVALDDFGSGYSSIRYLANMPVDIVKFDISMVHDLNKDQRTRIIIEHTAALINEAGYKLVAEGIESAEILQRAAALNPSHYQGFLFGKPQPIDTVFVEHP